MNLRATDAVDGIESLDEESVQLTVTSPPYNIGKGYDGNGDRLDMGDWRQLIEDVASGLFRVTKPDGKVVINIGKSYPDTDEEGRFHFHPLAAYVKLAFTEAGFDMWDEIIWNKRSFNSRGGGALFGSYPHPTNLMVTQTHEHIIVFRKWVSESYHRTRELPPKDEKDESALEKERWRELTQSIWEIDGVRQSGMELDHNAVYPVEIPKRAIEMYSFKGDTVLDPFIGAGTTAVAAKELERDCIGFDISESYIRYAKDRVGATDK